MLAIDANPGSSDLRKALPTTSSSVNHFSLKIKAAGLNSRHIQGGDYSPVGCSAFTHMLQDGSPARAGVGRSFVCQIER